MRLRHRLLQGIVAVAIVAGPAFAGSPPPAGLKTHADSQAFQGMAETGWPETAWWKDWGDPQLNALIDEALAGVPSVAQADARMRKAAAEAHEVGARELPSLSGQATVAMTQQSDNLGFPKQFATQFIPQGYNAFGKLDLDFSWEIDFWGKNRAAVAAATSDATAARADAAEARLMLAADIAAQYADLARLYNERDVAERALKVREATETLVAKRVDNGLDTRAELSQAQAGPPSERANLAALDEQIALARNALAALVGTGPDRGLAIQRPGVATLKPLGLPPSLAANLIGRRPDIVAARWRAQAAEHRVKQARAAFYPNVNLVAYVGQEALHLDNLFVTGSSIGQVGPALSLPIFDGGRLRSELRGARADNDAAIAAYDGAVIQALHEVADAVARERALSARLTESRAALAADEDAHRIARLRYDGGLATYQSVLLAENAVLEQRRVVTDLESRALTLDIALIRALGGGFSA